jgi:hypothetical protein
MALSLGRGATIIPIPSSPLLSVSLQPCRPPSVTDYLLYSAPQRPPSHPFSDLKSRCTRPRPLMWACPCISQLLGFRMSTIICAEHAYPISTQCLDTPAQILDPTVSLHSALHDYPQRRNYHRWRQTQLCGTCFCVAFVGPTLARIISPSQNRNDCQNKDSHLGHTARNAVV